LTDSRLRATAPVKKYDVLTQSTLSTQRVLGVPEAREPVARSLIRLQLVSWECLKIAVPGWRVRIGERPAAVAEGFDSPVVITTHADILEQADHVSGAHQPAVRQPVRRTIVCTRAQGMIAAFGARDHRVGVAGRCPKMSEQRRAIPPH